MRVQYFSTNIIIIILIIIIISANFKKRQFWLECSQKTQWVSTWWSSAIISYSHRNALTAKGRIQLGLIRHRCKTTDCRLTIIINNIKSMPSLPSLWTLSRAWRRTLFTPSVIIKGLALSVSHINLYHWSPFRVDVTHARTHARIESGLSVDYLRLPSSSSSSSISRLSAGAESAKCDVTVTMGISLWRRTDLLRRRYCCSSRFDPW